MNEDRKDQIPANRPENKEPAEGSRETVTGGDNAGGVTNRPLDREEQEQREVPPRGQEKHEVGDDARRGHSQRNDPAMPEDDAALNTKI
jgi:hypothetical protein